MIVKLQDWGVECGMVEGEGQDHTHLIFWSRMGTHHPRIGIFSNMDFNMDREIDFLNTSINTNFQTRMIDLRIL